MFGTFNTWVGRLFFHVCSSRLANLHKGFCWWLARWIARSPKYVFGIQEQLIRGEEKSKSSPSVHVLHEKKILTVSFWFCILFHKRNLLLFWRYKLLPTADFDFRKCYLRKRFCSKQIARHFCWHYKEILLFFVFSFCIW